MTPNNTKSLGSNLAKLFNLNPDEIDDSILMSVGAIAYKEVLASFGADATEWFNDLLAKQAEALRIAREDGA